MIILPSKNAFLMIRNDVFPATLSVSTPLSTQISFVFDESLKSDHTFVLK